MIDEEYQVIISLDNKKIRDIILWANEDSIEWEIEKFVNVDRVLRQKKNNLNISFKRKEANKNEAEQ